MLDGYNVEIEIEELGQHHVVLVIRALRLIVLGRTLGDAQQLARAAIASRSQDDERRWAQPAAARDFDDAIAASTEAPDASRAA